MNNLLIKTENEGLQTSKSNSECIMNSNGTIQHRFNIQIYSGKGYYVTGIKNTFWVTINVTAIIHKPDTGSWTVIIRDKENKDRIVYKNNNVISNKDFSFIYKTGVKTNLTIEILWNEYGNDYNETIKDTNLIGEMIVSY